eukprot:scaffold1729_cov375-Prasinococcus_capsulatus_cf.AAC.5
MRIEERIKGVRLGVVACAAGVRRVQPAKGMLHQQASIPARIDARLGPPAHAVGHANHAGPRRNEVRVLAARAPLRRVRRREHGRLQSQWGILGRRRSGASATVSSGVATPARPPSHPARASLADTGPRCEEEELSVQPLEQALLGMGRPASTVVVEGAPPFPFRLAGGRLHGRHAELLGERRSSARENVEGAPLLRQGSRRRARVA